jgi:hypothetical protein
MLYAIGQPGSGKTTAFRELTADAEGHVQYNKPIPYIWHQWGAGGVWEIGKRREGGFGGTDALGYTVQPLVVQWLNDMKPERVIAEGDRLANDGFFRAVLDLGYDLTIVLIDIPDDVAATRRAARTARLATKPQNPTWLKGRVTKVRNLLHTWSAYIQVYDGRRSPSDLAAQVRKHRVFDGLEMPT